jgi:hypothetical protein
VLLPIAAVAASGCGAASAATLAVAAVAIPSSFVLSAELIEPAALVVAGLIATVCVPAL